MVRSANTVCTSMLIVGCCCRIFWVVGWIHSFFFLTRVTCVYSHVRDCSTSIAILDHWAIVQCYVSCTYLHILVTVQQENEHNMKFSRNVIIGPRELREKLTESMRCSDSSWVPFKNKHWTRILVCCDFFAESRFVMLQWKPRKEHFATLARRIWISILQI